MIYPRLNGKRPEYVAGGQLNSSLLQTFVAFPVPCPGTENSTALMTLSSIPFKVTRESTAPRSVFTGMRSAADQAQFRLGRIPIEPDPKLHKNLCQLKAIVGIG